MNEKIANTKADLLHIIIIMMDRLHPFFRIAATYMLDVRHARS